MAKSKFVMSNRKVVQEINSATVLTKNDCGKVFLVDMSSSVAPYTVTLPSLQDAEGGWNAEFIVGRSGSVAKTVTIAQHSDDNTSIKKQLAFDETGNDLDGSLAEYMTFNSGSPDLLEKPNAGDRIRIWSVPDNGQYDVDAHWYAHCYSLSGAIG